jgi:3-dehydroshikimate dehydratase
MILSAFADEISNELDEQIRTLRRLAIGLIDLRSIDTVNVLSIDLGKAREARQRLDDGGIRVATIASPIGKQSLRLARIDAVLDDLSRAVEMCRIFGTHLIRIFSFASDDLQPEYGREVTIARLAALARRAREEDVTLLLENEEGTYADTVARSGDLLHAIDDPNLRMVLDPANFLKSGEAGGRNAFDTLRPWIAQLHVKDVDGGGNVVEAGRGRADWPAIVTAMVECDFQGIVSLEPHLAVAHQFGGFTGVDRFELAARDLRNLLSQVVKDKVQREELQL